MIWVDFQVAKQAKGNKPLQFGHVDGAPEGQEAWTQRLGGAGLSSFASKEMKPQTQMGLEVDFSSHLSSATTPGSRSPFICASPVLRHPAASTADPFMHPKCHIQEGHPTL